MPDVVDPNCLAAYVYQNDAHPRLARFDGVVWQPTCEPVLVRSAKAMKIDDGDIVISTYPKAGTTWLQHICLQLVRGEEYNPTIGNELWRHSPMIEGKGAAFALAMPRPRILKTHFNFRDAPWNPRAKYIYCVRNPKDSLTSYFHHHRNMNEYNFRNGEFAPFFEVFLQGQIGYGLMHDHILTWLPHINKANVLFVKYEDMLADLTAEIKRIGKFLDGAASEAVNNPTRLEHIVQNSTLESMKQDQGRWFPEMIIEKGTFIRKGCKRDWKNLLTKEQSNKMDEVWDQKMKGTIAEGWWKDDMTWDDKQAQ